MPMAELRSLYESLGFENVKTLLNSGNIVFDTKPVDERDLTDKIEKEFSRNFGFESKIMLRTMPEIETLVDLQPFQNINVDKDVRLYVTFLRETPDSSLKIPYTSAEKDFHILTKTSREIFWAINIKTSQTVKKMAYIEREFGSDVTTRNWNTVIKIAKL